MSHELAHDTEPVALYIILYGPRNVSHPAPRHGLGDALVKGLFCDIHQSLRQNPAAADRHRPSIVADKAVVNHSDIDAYKVAEGQMPLHSQTMDNLLVDRYASMARKFPVPATCATWVYIPQKCAPGAVMLHSRRGELIDLPGGNAGLNERANLFQDCAGHRTSGPHRFQVPLALENDHFQRLILNSILILISFPEPGQK